ncbi:MAG: hypothetical protein MJZ74_00055 [Muribaculaceae bacterium]|nr:hypothetical protein [Muribaculaceae bacterium]
MKKSILFIGAALMMLGAASCGGGNKDLTDREVLNLLHEKLNGDKWVEDTAGWGTDRPLAEWDGVKAETDANGVEHVIELKLRDDSLKGDIPAEIACLTELKELTIYVRNHQESIKNSVPAEIFTLPKVEKMHLYVSGKDHYTLPETMELPAIKDLEISGPEGSFEALCKLTTLEELEVNNFKGAIPESVGNLTNLTSMKWETSEEAVGRVPAAIGKMTKLERLTVDYSAFIGGPGQAAAEFPVELWDNTNLKYIFLRNVASKPSTLPAEKIAAMTNLENIVLCRCGIEGTIPVEFFKSGKLRTFEIYDNNLTGTIPAEICNCVDMTTIMLQRNKLSGEIPANIGNCTKLTTLWLYENADLGGSIPASLAKCEKLIIFGLKGTKVSQEVPAAFKAHPKYDKFRIFE